MAAEREARVLIIADGCARLQPLAQCTGCGCQGRCDLFALTRQSGDAVMLPLGQFDRPPTPGVRVRLYLPPEALLQQAWRGYGWPLGGLLSGALCGYVLAAGAGVGVDSGTAVMAALGTWLGIRRSKRGFDPLLRAQVLDA